MPEFRIDFSVYCGICGSGICRDTDVNDRSNDVTVTCSTCKAKINDLENEVERLQQELSDKE